MMRAVVALLVSVSMLGCFPHNEKHQTYAKLAEGGALVAGIAISAFSNTGADCEMMKMNGVDTNCSSNAKLLSGVGVALILGGLLGFVATVSTAENDAKPPVTVTPAQPTAQKPAEPKKDEPVAPAAPAAAEPAGSASPAPAAP